MQHIEASQKQLYKYNKIGITYLNKGLSHISRMIKIYINIYILYIKIYLQKAITHFNYDSLKHTGTTTF